MFIWRKLNSLMRKVCRYIGKLLVITVKFYIILLCFTYRNLSFDGEFLWMDWIILFIYQRILYENIGPYLNEIILKYFYNILYLFNILEMFRIWIFFYSTTVGL